MGDIINLDTYRDSCDQIFEHDDADDRSTIYVYRDRRSGEIEIVQINDDGEAIRTVMTSIEASLLARALVQPAGGCGKVDP